MLVSCLLGQFVTLALAAPPFTLPSLTLIKPPHINASVPNPIRPPPPLKYVKSSSYRQHHTHPCSHLPSSPYYYTDPSSPVVVKFYAYGLALPEQHVRSTLGSALRDINAQLHPQDPITDRQLRYSSGNVYLLMHQNGQMTWDVLETAIWGLMHFVQTYECVDFDFDIGEFGMERAFGTGALGVFR